MIEECFEYKVCQLYAPCDIHLESSSSELELGLNELGNEGWEVIKMEIYNERALCVAKRKRR